MTLSAEQKRKKHDLNLSLLGPYLLLFNEKKRKFVQIN